MNPNVSITKSGPGAQQLRDRLESLGKSDVLVGIPQAATERGDKLLSRATKLKPGKRQTRLVTLSESEVTNAQILYIHTHGSPARNIPARPVIEPAIAADGNREQISGELAEAAKAHLEGSPEHTDLHLRRAGMAGRNASVNWFTDARNNWAPNRPSTIRRKKSDRPLIDTGALRRSLTYVVRVQP
jgi:hypothetical protein